MLDRLAADGARETKDLSQSTIAARHLRNLVGGKERVPFEKFFQYNFPERPGALLRFLECVAPAFNITLFHYRSSDAQTAEILIGVQVSPGQESSFEAVTQSLEAEEFQCTDLSAHEGEMEGLKLLVGGD